MDSLSLTKTHIQEIHAAWHRGRTAGSISKMHWFLLSTEDKTMKDNTTHYLPHPGHTSSFLPTPWDIKVSTNPAYPPPPLCHLSTRPSGGRLRDRKTRVWLLRRSPQLHGASASPACRHAAIHCLITMEERSGGCVKVGYTNCNQLPVAVFLCTAQPSVPQTLPHTGR